MLRTAAAFLKETFLGHPDTPEDHSTQRSLQEPSHSQERIEAMPRLWVEESKELFPGEQEDQLEIRNSEAIDHYGHAGTQASTSHDSHRPAKNVGSHRISTAETPRRFVRAKSNGNGLEDAHVPSEHTRSETTTNDRKLNSVTKIDSTSSEDDEYASPSQSQLSNTTHLVDRRRSVGTEELDSVSSSEEEIISSARKSTVSHAYSGSSQKSPYTDQGVAHPFLDRITIRTTGFPQNVLNPSAGNKVRRDYSERASEIRSNSNLSILSTSDDSEEDAPNSTRKRQRSREKWQPIAQSSGTSTAQQTAKKVSDFKRDLSELETTKDIRRLYPRSLQPGAPQHSELADERRLLYTFLVADKADKLDSSAEENSFLSITLSNFSIYRSIRDKGLKGQLESLHVVAIDQERYRFYFDGTVLHKGQQIYLEGIPIKSVSIGGYDDSSIHTTKGLVWVQSEQGPAYGDAWYELDTPSSEYRDLWADFQWLADFSKYFIDYICMNCDLAHSVELNDFESDFMLWLDDKHSNDQGYLQWREKCGNRYDLRQHIIDFCPLLKNQVYNFEPSLFDKHEIWKQVCPGFINDCTPINEFERTVVTRNVGESFLKAFPLWGRASTGGKPGYDLIEIVDPCDEVSKRRQERMRALHLPDKFRVSQTQNFQDIPGEGLKSKVDLDLQNASRSLAKTPTSAEHLKGKVVIVELLREKQEDYEYEYGLVQGSSYHGDMLQVVWLLPPSQTVCGSGFYPIGNELFLSDRCNCKLVPLSKVVHVSTVSLLTDQSQEGAAFFIEMLYENADEGMIVTADQQDVDFQCNCAGQKSRDACQPRKRHCSYTSPSKDRGARKMRICSLFSGCGILDKGMESSGVVETIFAIDIDATAMQSHAANQPNRKCTHVTGSVNVCLKRLLQGKDPMLDIDCVVAGCPCQGFSLRNLSRSTKRAQKNCSLLACTLSYVELYTPAYVVIENVLNMDSVGSQNYCEQAICTLVALGYQVQKWRLLASEYGSSQRRKRLFIIATACGFQVPEVPVPTHGWMTYTPEVTASEATAGLGPVDNDTIVNIRDPSHVPVLRLKRTSDGVSLRSIVSKIPKKPYGRNFYDAYEAGLLMPHENDWVELQSEEKRSSRRGGLRRRNPHKPFATVLTNVQVVDARASAMIHWEQDRTLTLAEVRIAMGILQPSDMILTGTLKEQLKQLGNGVPFQLGSAVGKSVGDAWTDTHVRKTGSGAGSRHESSSQKPNFTLEIRSRWRSFQQAINSTQPSQSATNPLSASMSFTNRVMESIRHDKMSISQQSSQRLRELQRISHESRTASIPDYPLAHVSLTESSSRISMFGSGTMSKRKRVFVEVPPAREDTDDDCVILEVRRVQKKSRAETRSTG